MNKWVIVILTLFILGGVAQTQERYSGILTVRYGLVQFVRENTVQAFPLTQQAVMPFGEGDTLTTGDEGRALIALPMGEWMLLPNSSLTLTRLERIEEVWYIDATIDGVLVQVARSETNAEVNIQAGNLVIRGRGLQMAVWHYPQTLASVALAEGALLVLNTLTEETFAMSTGDALWSDVRSTQLIQALGFPLNASRFEAHLFGCEGVVDTIGDIGVLVRRGIGQRHERLGLIPDGAKVSVLAINDAGYWLRIQYLSGFSWIIEEAVNHDCNNLTRLPDNSLLERIMRIVNPSDREIEFLKPYYQTPLEDTFFYQYRGN